MSKSEKQQDIEISNMKPAAYANFCGNSIDDYVQRYVRAEYSEIDNEDAESLQKVLKGSIDIIKEKALRLGAVAVVNIGYHFTHNSTKEKKFVICEYDGIAMVPKHTA
jgi:hypothetical protein